MPRVITEGNFPVFIQLMKDAMLKLNGSEIMKPGEVVAEVFATTISHETGKAIGGRTLINFVDAVIAKDLNKINPGLNSLNCLAKFVLNTNKAPEEQKAEDKKNKQPLVDSFPYWTNYVEKNKHLLLQHGSTSIAYLKGNVQESKTDELAKPEISETIASQQTFKNEQTLILQNDNNNTFSKEGAESEPINTPAVPRVKSKFKRLAIPSILVFFIIIFIGYIAFQTIFPNENFIFTESFENTSDDSLFTKGWFLINKDSAYCNKRNAKEKSLTLYTLVGDYWVGNDDNSHRYIANNLVFPLPDRKEDFEVEVEIDNFFPSQCCQQAGFIFLKDTADLSNNFRYVIKRNLNDSNPPLCFQFVYSESNNIKYKSGISGNYIQEDSIFCMGNSFYKYSNPGLQKIWLNVVKKGKQLTCRNKIFRDDRNYVTTNTFTSTYRLNYICLAAFQAYPHEFNDFKAVPVIPATFRNFKLKVINEN